MTKKSVLEQALLQVSTLEEAVKHNTKEIMTSVLKEELKDLLKGKEEEDEYPADGENSPEGEENDVTGDKPEDEEPSITDTDAEPDNDADDTDSMGEEPGDEGSFDDGPDVEPDHDEDDETLDMTKASDGEVLKVFRAMKPEDGIVVKRDGNKLEFSVDDEDYIIKLDDEDGEENLSEQHSYSGGKEDEAGFGLGSGEEDWDNDQDESLYEITLDDEEPEGEFHEEVSGEDPFDKSVNSKRNQKAALGGGKKEMGKGGAIGDKDPFDKSANTSRNQKAALGGGKKELGKGGAVGNDDPFNKGANTSRNQKAGLGGKKEVAEEEDTTTEEGDQTESARTAAWGYRPGLKSKKTAYAGNKRDQVGNGGKSLEEQFDALKKQNAEYRKALVLFKEKINEVAVFNANLAYAVRLITEHTTTKQEKLNILKRFDSISTITESKTLYNLIEGELSNKKPIVETVGEKITSTPKTSSSAEVLSEAKAYESPQFRRMKELMGKI